MIVVFADRRDGPCEPAGPRSVASLTVGAAEWFVAFAMCLLALQKLKDVDSFATMFLQLRPAGAAVGPYGTSIPFAEGWQAS